MNNYVHLGDLIQSISQTHSFDKDALVFLNTSDVQAGKILINHYTQVSELKGQAKKAIKNGDILYSEIRPKNKRYAYVKNIKNIEDYVVSTKLMVLRNCFKDLDTDYLYHFLTYEKTLDFLQQRAENRIGSFPQITFEVLKTLQIWLPDIKTQRKIASILSTLDSKIELNNRINTQLEEMAKTIYDYWFVQFDFPNGQGKPYKSSGGKMVYNKELKREISEGWEVKPLADWINKDKGGDWGKESEEANYSKRVNCIRGADINGLIGKGELKSPIRYILKKNSSKILQPNDLIIEISGGSPTQSTGRLAYITENTFERFDNPVICSNFCKAINLKEDNHLYYFAYYWNLIYESNILFGWEGKTSGIKNLLFESFVNYYKIPVPNELLIEKFNALITPIESKKQKNLKQNQELASLRDWLFPMLMNGQVTVKEAEEKLDSMSEFNQSIAAEPQAEYHK